VCGATAGGNAIRPILLELRRRPPVFFSLLLDVAVPFRPSPALLRHDWKNHALGSDPKAGSGFPKRSRSIKKRQARSWFHRERSRIQRDSKNENRFIGKFSAEAVMVGFYRCR
jgi:hypothetical protein